MDWTGTNLPNSARSFPYSGTVPVSGAGPLPSNSATVGLRHKTLVRIVPAPSSTAKTGSYPAKNGQVPAESPPTRICCRWVAAR